VTALDASPEVLALARARAGEARVSYEQADIFAWEPERSFDVCFFSFWLSHVPEERFESFWSKVARALRPEGRVFFIDSLRNEQAGAADHQLPDGTQETMQRRLADGREFRIVKRFHEIQALQDRLTALGWSADVKQTPEFFLYGSASPRGG
jgi:demethylmenaquinone methyltransferase/2-methoxy-6-polyprenyl-1,4-benzoquinol methylase